MAAVFAQVREELGIAGSRWVIRVDRKRIMRGDRPFFATRYSITNLDPMRVSPQQLLQWVRGHWEIENSLHYVKDRWWDEDRDSLRRSALGAIRATLTNAAINVLRFRGHHRLLCGDAGKPEDADRLLSHGQDVRATIQLANTDPAYNLPVEPRSNNATAAGLISFKGTGCRLKVAAAPPPRPPAYSLQPPASCTTRRWTWPATPNKARATHRKLRAKVRPLENDFVSEDEFNRPLHASFGQRAQVLLPGHPAYIWGGYANLGNYPPVLREHKLYFSQGIVWDKEHPVLTRKDRMGSRVERVPFAWKRANVTRR